MRPLLFVAALALAAPAAAQITVAVDASVGPSLSVIGASGTVQAQGIPIPLGRVEFPTAVGIDARLRADVHGRTWGGRVGVGYLGANDVFDGVAVFIDDGVDVAFVVASGEVTYRQPYGAGTVVAGLGPEVRVILDEGSADRGLLRLLGDVRQSHVAVGGSLGIRFPVGAVVLGPEIRGGLALTPLSDDRVEAFGGAIRLDGDFRFDHVSISLTVAFPSG